jgi:cob(I)alamin adenosyltransferase
MVQLTRIYTKSGDKGKTSLGNGKRVLKSSSRIHAIGTVDEANSFLGVALMHIQEDKMRYIILKIQNDLFDVGADLCLPETAEKIDYQPLRVTKQQVDFLEKKIDFYNAALLPLQSFILPGGSEASSYMHLCRTVVRRAERYVCSIAEEEAEHDKFVSQLVIQYLNRLSDLLFVLARIHNNNGKNDVLWIPGGEEEI